MVEGQQLPELVRGPITRGTLALFAGASHDHVPLHIDSDFARAAGMDDVFAHGMLSMAYLAQALRSWAPAERVRTWNVRFTAITPLHATVHCRGEVAEIFSEAGERRARLKIGAWTDRDIQTLDGEAVVAID
jgi:acyl dehydratase